MTNIKIIPQVLAGIPNILTESGEILKCLKNRKRGKNLVGEALERNYWRGLIAVKKPGRASCWLGGIVRQFYGGLEIIC
ncbi:hypothetical protein [Dyadobacter sp. SG02]|uniref:hypothetical protein n=1 Tax=Dyadobacter sp. SG02 TaxID=1855291 RepID=UPI00115FE5A6|nr:hypothetical protein [Dyadobacter sp. SG02]